MSTTPNLLIPFLSALTGPNTAAKIDDWNAALTGTLTPTNGFAQLFYMRVLDLTSLVSPANVGVLYPGAWFFAGTTSGTFAVEIETQIGWYLFFNDTAHDITVIMGSGSPFSGGNTITIPNDGNMHFVYSDGTGNLLTTS